MKRILVSLGMGLALAACSRADVPQPEVVGGDQDAHGCYPSAGYSWCAASGQCERPWELADEKNFENSRAAFDAYCKNDDQP